MKVWDYNLPEGWKPETDEAWIWYLERKINYGDFEGLNAQIIKRYLPQLRLDEGKRLMIEAYFDTQDYGA